MFSTNDLHIFGRCFWKLEAHTEIALTRSVVTDKKNFESVL
jgi:hypothetical protein